MAMGDFPCRIPSTMRSHRYSAWRRLAPIKDTSPAIRSGDGCSRTICARSLPIPHEPDARTPFSGEYRCDSAGHFHHFCAREK